MVKRVLVTGAAKIGKAGVATIVYKWGQHFDSDTVVYDYLMQSGLPDAKYQRAIKNKEGVIYTFSGKKTIINIIHWVTTVIKDNDYKILHINSDSAYVAAAYIYAAKKAGIEKIYVHSHCTQIDDSNDVCRAIKTVLHKICMPYVCANTNMYLACSKIAGEWMFGKRNVHTDKYRTIYNGVEVKDYLYNTDVRESIRDTLNLKDKYVLANIGRLSFQKNQKYLITLFAKYHDINPNSMLFIVGEGELLDQLKNMVSQLNLQDAVVFMGVRNDVSLLLSAFDVLVMPSRFEGLPVTMVEAQMADLPCVVSGNITREAKFTANVQYVENWEIDSWIAAIENAKLFKRKRSEEEKASSKFNIINASKALQEVLIQE